MRDISPRFALGALTAALMCLSLTSVAHAQSNTSGGGDAVRSSSFGIGIGSVTKASGLSLKLPMGPTSIQAGLGLGGFGRGAGFGVGADFLLEMPTIADLGFMAIAWELGLGGGLAAGGDHLSVAASGVAGLQFNFNVLPSLPFDLVIEWRPTLNIIPDVDINFLGATGHLRVYF